MCSDFSLDTHTTLSPSRFAYVPVGKNDLPQPPASALPPRETTSILLIEVTKKFSRLRAKGNNRTATVGEREGGGGGDGVVSSSANYRVRLVRHHMHKFLRRNK